MNDLPAGHEQAAKAKTDPLLACEKALYYIMQSVEVSGALQRIHASVDIAGLLLEEIALTSAAWQTPGLPANLLKAPFGAHGEAASVANISCQLVTRTKRGFASSACCF